MIPIRLLITALLVTHVAVGTQNAPFTVIVIPDPQLLAQSTCTISGVPIMSYMTTFAVTNKQLVVDGSPLNSKIAITTGDTLDSETGTHSAASIRMEAAFQVLESGGIGVIRVVGNHNYQVLNPLDRSTIGYAWRNDTNGAWSPSNLASIYGGSGFNLGDSDTLQWGGAYIDPTYTTSSANAYYLANISGRKILITAIELFSRLEILTWVKALHDTNLNRELWIPTHAILTTNGVLMGRATPGPDGWGLTNPASTTTNPGIAPTEMWNGFSGSVSSFPGVKTWMNLTMLLGGHDTNGYDGIGAHWPIHNLDLISTSPRHQTVRAIFSNSQDRDTANCTDPASDMAHLGFLRITPTTATYYYVSTRTGLWTGAPGSGITNSPNPIPIFSVPFEPILVNNQIKGSTSIRGSVTVR